MMSFVPGDDIEVSPLGNFEGGRGSIRLRDIMRRQQRRDSDQAIEAPDLDFDYQDSDSFERELGELFAYSEIRELKEYRSHFFECLKEKAPTADVQSWSDLSQAAQKGIVIHFTEKLELVDKKERYLACVSILYLVLGAYSPGMTPENLLRSIRSTVFLMLDCGVFPLVLQVLRLELEAGVVVEPTQKTGMNISHNKDIRICLDILYVFVETLRRPDPCDTPEWTEKRLVFIEEISNPTRSEDSLTQTLFAMLLRFCSSAQPHFPIKKIVLVIWKVILATLGGLNHVEAMKELARVKAGLHPKYETPHDIKPVILPVQKEEHSLLPKVGRSESESRRSELASALEKFGEGVDGVKPKRGLEFRPKVRQSEVDLFIEASTNKFGTFDATNPNSETAGLPRPIQESISVLQAHVYKPLSEVQIKEEEDVESRMRRSFGDNQCKLPERNTRTERLYEFMVPNLPQYMISFLKVLLAASPTAKAKSDSLNILVDVLPFEEPASVIESSQLNLDIQRHKEIIVKAVSAILLLLLKYFKLNHIYQFEFMSQHLVFVNCIPLVLKFFNQIVAQYVAAKNTLLELEFVSYVTSHLDKPTFESLEPVCLDQGYCWRNLFACINLLRILQKLTKWKHSRIMMMVVFKSAPILKRTLKVRHPLIRLYTLKLLKAQTKYLGRNWRRSNMKVISSIYQTVRHHLHDDWAYGNDLDARPWDFQTEEITLRDCVDRFNARYYGDSTKEVSDSEFDFTPVDNNVLSVLGSSDIQLTQEEMDHWEEWVQEEVFTNPLNWDSMLVNTAIFF